MFYLNTVCTDLKINNFLSRVTSKFGGWPCKTVGHLFYAASSFVHHFITISQLKLELQSGNAKFGSKSAIFLSCVTFKFGGWKALCIISEPSVNSNWSYSPETPNLGQNQKFFVPCDLEIWWMTLKNNRAPLLCLIKLCVSFHWHMWIQTWVMVWKRLNWVLTSVTLIFDL